MTAPLDDVNDIREMDAAGVLRAEIACRLRLSRNSVVKYAVTADVSPAAPQSQALRHPPRFRAGCAQGSAVPAVARPSGRLHVTHVAEVEVFDAEAAQVGRASVTRP